MRPSQNLKLKNPTGKKTAKGPPYRVFFVYDSPPIVLCLNLFASDWSKSD